MRHSSSLRAAASAFGIGKPETLVIDIKRVVEGCKGTIRRKAARESEKRAGKERKKAAAT